MRTRVKASTRWMYLQRRLCAFFGSCLLFFVAIGYAHATQMAMKNDAGMFREVPQGAFFAWQTRWTKLQAEGLQNSGWKKLYLRFFDVKFDSELREPRPEAPIAFLAPLPKAAELVAVVYLENQVFLKSQAAQLEALPRNVFGKLKSLLPATSAPFVEILIDCDWTPSTREAYFAFLQSFKVHSSGVRVSATIRLHQVKYSTRTGVPPVERGLLMFYNMGQLEAAGHILQGI